MRKLPTYPTITFRIREPGQEPREVTIRGEPVIKIGQLSSAGLCIHGPGVSRMHGYLQLMESGAIYLSDLGSAHGTQVNGQRVNKAKLKEGDVIDFGEVEVTIARVEGASEAQQTGKTATDAGRIRTSPFREVAAASARPTFCERCFYVENTLREMARIDGRIQCAECSSVSGLSHAHATLLAGAQLQQAIKISAQLGMLDGLLGATDMEKLLKELGVQS